MELCPVDDILTRDFFETKQNISLVYSEILNLSYRILDLLSVVFMLVVTLQSFMVHDEISDVTDLRILNLLP